MIIEDGNTGATSTPTQEPTEPAQEQTVQSTESNPPAEPEKPDRVFTRDEVTQILSKRLKRNNKRFYERLGIKDESEFDGYLQQRNQMATELDDLKNKNLELTRTNSFLKNNIKPDKYDDIIAYFKGTGIEFNEDELLKQLATHPEWLNQPVAQPAPEPKPQATVTQLSPGRGVVIPESEEEKMDRVFGFKK